RSRDLIGGDVVDLELPGIDVAQYQVGGARAVDWGNPGELPLQADRAQDVRAGDLIVGEARDLPIESDRTHECGIRDLVVADVVDLQSSGVNVAQDHVVFARIAA